MVCYWLFNTAIIFYESSYLTLQKKETLTMYISFHMYWIMRQNISLYQIRTQGIFNILSMAFVFDSWWCNISKNQLLATCQWRQTHKLNIGSTYQNILFLFPVRDLQNVKNGEIVDGKYWPMFERVTDAEQISISHLILHMYI